MSLRSGTTSIGPVVIAAGHTLCRVRRSRKIDLTVNGDNRAAKARLTDINGERRAMEPGVTTGLRTPMNRPCKPPGRRLEVSRTKAFPRSEPLIQRRSILRGQVLLASAR